MSDRPRIAVVTFPGSNDDGDAALALEFLGATPVPVWHADAALPDGVEGVILPGGFSYGDYLRCGAIARFAPVMADVRRFADDGGPMLGICNGFQILCEAGLLPGALVRNRSLSFICEPVTVRVEAVGDALRTLGFAVSGARVGRLVDVELDDADPAEAQAALESMARDLLANPLIESFTIEVESAHE